MFHNETNCLAFNVTIRLPTEFNYVPSNQQKMDNQKDVTIACEGLQNQFLFVTVASYNNVIFLVSRA